MTTSTAQRQLLEALANLNKTAGGIGGMLLLWPELVAFTESQNMPELAAVLQRFSDLARAVEADQNGVHHA